MCQINWEALLGPGVLVKGTVSLKIPLWISGVSRSRDSEVLRTFFPQSWPIWQELALGRNLSATYILWRHSARTDSRRRIESGAITQELYSSRARPTRRDDASSSTPRSPTVLTTYEPAHDRLSISALLTYLNTAMPADKHEDFDTGEVVRAAAALAQAVSASVTADARRMAEQSVPPLLPPELEREIFELAAYTRPRSIPKLMLVAWRVKAWVETLFYRVLLFSEGRPGLHGAWTYPDDADDVAHFSRTFSIPPSALRANVQHLCILHSDKELINFLLRNCLSVHDLWAPAHATLDLVGALPLNRLHCTLRSVFNTTPVDFTHSLLLQMTHPEMFDEAEDLPIFIWSSSALICNLTHLAFNDDGPHPPSLIMLTIVYLALLGFGVAPWQHYIEAGRHLPAGATLLQILPVVFIGSAMLFSILSIGYTVGYVVVSLAMIESAVAEHKPPLFPTHSEVDDCIPVTTSLRGAMRILQRAGASCWHGVGQYALYCAVHFIMTYFWSRIYGAGVLSVAAISAGVSVALARQHMCCTHRMIAHPADADAAAGLNARTECRVLFLPSLVYAVVQQATILLAFALVWEIGHTCTDTTDFGSASQSHLPALALLLFNVQILFVLSFLLILSLIFLLHTSIVITHIEAALLPVEMSPLVPVDRKALFGGSGLNLDSSWASSLAILRLAWRSSCTMERCLRVGKIYAKMLGMQSAVLLVGVGSIFGLVTMWL
ncbi:hypothetical protein FB45DRAFT_870282 [Roridomyces roridus]|uniref:Uncharacterized protein n=1 Tax=Roridomyces roridus TaxID=1738132 RepID=A0AAD7FG10_9AGAR|nr:hypothetical protein FB45DRAFT_870282 [Roridomyces roridus]